MMPRMGNPAGGAKYKKPEHYAAEHEITSRLAAAKRSNGEGCDDAAEQVARRVYPEIFKDGPPSLPTLGQPTAAIEDVAADSIIATPYMSVPLFPDPRYRILRTILDAAFAHAATGKGKERHARDLPFDDQPMLETTRLVGPGFPLGQAIKKAGEAAGMIERGQMDAAEAECLGAINYLAGAVAWMREGKVA